MLRDETWRVSIYNLGEALEMPFVDSIGAAHR
jgi:hypothetical protein